jgi:hypothetical protein
MDALIIIWRSKLRISLADWFTTSLRLPRSKLLLSIMTKTTVLNGEFLDYMFGMSDEYNGKQQYFEVVHGQLSKFVGMALYFDNFDNTKHFKSDQARPRCGSLHLRHPTLQLG